MEEEEKGGECELKQQSFHRRVVDRASLRRPQKNRRESLSPEAIKDGMNCLATSQRDISIAKLQMEGLLEKSRRRMQRLDNPGGNHNSNNHNAEQQASRAKEEEEEVGILGGVKSGRARLRAREDSRRARRAAEQVQRMITDMDDSLRREEAGLNQRATQLRRQSVGAFKQMSDIQKRPSHNSGFDPSEEDDKEEDEEDLFDGGEGEGAGDKSGVSGRVREAITEEEDEDGEVARGSVRVQMTQL